MKIKNLLILGMVLVGFSYCSSDDVLDGTATGNEKAENLKMEITIQMPTGATTRSSTDGSTGAAPTTEVGTVEENQANSVTVVITKPGTSEIVSTYTSSSSDGSFAGSSFFTTAEFTVADMKINDTFDVYAFVNPYDGFATALDNAFTNETSLEDAIKAVTKRTVDGAVTQDNFFMSNAKKVTSEALNASHIKGAALKVAVDVQRAVARMDYVSHTSDDTYGIKYSDDAESDVKVKFTGYKLMNTSKSFYNLKRVNADGDITAGTIGGAEIADNYVVDTDWGVKLTDTGWDTGFFNYMGKTATNNYKELANNSYVTENTMPANNRSKKGLATAVVFKGRLVVPESYTNPTPGHQYISTATSPVYVWNNKFYGTFDKLPQSIQNIVTAGTTGEISDTAIAAKNTDLANAGVTGYSYVENAFGTDSHGYPVYYVYYNRHNDNGDASVTGPMEFATVRNNIYKLTINSLSKFGHPNDPEGPVVNPDPNPEKPEDDIESSTLYMQVTATVLDWTVRQNNIEF